MRVQLLPQISAGVVVASAGKRIPIDSSPHLLRSQLHELTLCSGTLKSGAPRDILQSRHATNFVGEELFDEFARTLCTANAIPRKELFESWATALFVHDQFPDDISHRVADLACGHGLLSWALLLLGQESGRTAVCIDRHMPKSADKVAEVMTTRWPQLGSRWDFVESKLDAIVPCSSTLLCGVHACGVLSDQIISLAIRGNSPLTLVPCCHTKKSLDRMAREEFKTNPAGCDLSDFIDSRRIERLQDAGFSVEQRQIPKNFTPKNTIIMASPPSIDHRKNIQAVNASSGKLPRPIRFPLSSCVQVPIGDNPSSIEIVKSLSGRTAAAMRKQPPPPSLCVSLLIPPMTHSRKLITPETLAKLANDISEDSVKVKIDYADNEAFLHPSGNYARTFRVTYSSTNHKTIEKYEAKQLLVSLSKQIPVTFEGCTVRGQSTK